MKQKEKDRTLRIETFCKRDDYRLLRTSCICVICTKVVDHWYGIADDSVDVIITGVKVNEKSVRLRCAEDTRGFVKITNKEQWDRLKFILKTGYSNQLIDVYPYLYEKCKDWMVENARTTCYVTVVKEGMWK